jgi:hypothetical protein
MRAQVSVEYLSIYVLLFIPVIVSGLVAYGNLISSMQTASYQSSARALQAAADKVFAEGSGSSTQVFVSLPKNINWSRSFIGTPYACPAPFFSLTTLDKDSPTTFQVAARVIGNWSQFSGQTSYDLRVLDSGVVAVMGHNKRLDAVANYSWLTYSIERGNAYAVFPYSGSNYQFQNLSSRPVTSISGYFLPVMAVANVDNASRQVTYSMICANENQFTCTNCDCRAELYYYDGSWQAGGKSGQFSQTVLSGNTLVASGTLTYPATASNVTIRAVTNDTFRSISPWVQKAFLPASNSYFFWYNGAANSSSSGTTGSCLTNEPCTNQSAYFDLYKVADYRQFGAWLGGNNAICYFGTY